MPKVRELVKIPDFKWEYPNDSYKSGYQDGYIKAVLLISNLEVPERITPQEWFITPNPLLGNVSPIDMIQVGRGDKLCAWIVNQIKESSKNTKLTDKSRNLSRSWNLTNQQALDIVTSISNNAKEWMKIKDVK